MLSPQRFAETYAQVGQSLDDGSTDNSPCIIQELARLSKKIRHLHKENSGIVDALNYGLRFSTGEFIARQDADDISMPIRLEKQLTYLYSHPECIAVSCGFYDINGDGELTGRRYHPHDPNEANYTAFPAYEPYLPHPFLLMRAKAMRELGYRHVFHAEDADLYWRAIKRGRLANIRECYGFYRIHSGSVSGRSVSEGRIQAVFSQLCAISAMRVDLGREDIDFDPSWLKTCRDLNTLQEMTEFFASLLSVAELNYLRMASALKLVEFAGFRPYELQESDVSFLITHCSFKKISIKSNKINARSMVRRALRHYGGFKLIWYYYLRAQENGYVR